MNSVVRRHRDELVLVLPLRTRNPLNGSQAGYYAKARARKRERTLVALALRPQLAGLALPVRVLVTRIAPRELDAWDGLGAALKGCIDGVADAFGVRDDDPRLAIEVAQRRGQPREYAVEVHITGARQRAPMPVAPPSGTLLAGE